MVAKGFLRLPDLHMLMKQKSLSLPRNLALRTFGELSIVFSTKVNLLYHLYPGLALVLSSASDKAKLFAENFYTNLDDSGNSLPVFPCRTNLKLHNISVTHKMVKNVIMNLDLSKVSGPDWIPEMVLKNCEPEFSYILAELFTKCLKESCFPDCWKVSLMVPVFKNGQEMSAGINYSPVSHLSVVSKKLANNRIVDHQKKCDLFSNFQYGFRSS